MTDPRAEHAERSGPADAELPRTGEPEVDRALQSLQGLRSEPLSAHHDRLARVHEELHAALSVDRPASGS